MAHCNYWWFAGEVEWCDRESEPCKCGGWEESCAFRRRKKRDNFDRKIMRKQSLAESPEEMQHVRHVQHAKQT